jgi:nucleoside-diphosphate-sugar epimerase
MRVLITGSEGYIGAVMRDVLLGRGHEVAGLDTGYFSECDLHVKPTEIPLVRKDLRHVERGDLEGFDAVAHLAALSNDPLGSLDAGLTQAINTTASLKLAHLAKEAGVQRFIFASSCSLYGHGAATGLTEDAPFNPQTGYARSKVDVEEGLRALASDGFSPVYLRNATAFGLSPRLRFDLVVNNLCGWAAVTGKIMLTSDGSPWRPLVHIRDISKAFACCLEAPRQAIHNEAFNVGSTTLNYQIASIAHMVAGQFPGCDVVLGKSDGDTRTYNVDFTKIHKKLPGFEGVDYTVEAGIAELKACFEQMQLDEPQFHSHLYTRLKQIQHLQEEGRLDDALFWRDAV